MSAANMDLNVQTLSQIGGALQKLNADGTLDEAGTQQMTAALAQQLGGSFTQIAYFGERDRRFRERDRFGGFWRCAVSIVVFLSSFGRVRAPERWV
jgi:filamentous hemagglutinin